MSAAEGSLLDASAAAVAGLFKEGSLLNEPRLGGHREGKPLTAAWPAWQSNKVMVSRQTCVSKKGRNSCRHTQERLSDKKGTGKPGPARALS